MTITTNYSGIGSIYFFRIIKEIIKLGKLEEGNKIILDYGCGFKILNSKIKNNKVLNYDINPKHSDFDCIDNLQFDYVVFNHVLMYLNEHEINELFKKINKINPKCKFLIGLGKQNLLSNIGKFITLNFNAHSETVLSYDDQIKIIYEKMKILNYKKNIFFMTDVYEAHLI